METTEQYDEFYDKEFKCGNSTITRAELESLPAPFYTKDADDDTMQSIVNLANTYTKIAMGLNESQELDFEDDRTSEAWWKELEEVVEFYEIPYYEDLKTE